MIDDSAEVHDPDCLGCGFPGKPYTLSARGQYFGDRLSGSISFGVCDDCMNTNWSRVLHKACVRLSGETEDEPGNPY